MRVVAGPACPPVSHWLAVAVIVAGAGASRARAPYYASALQLAAEEDSSDDSWHGATAYHQREADDAARYIVSARARRIAGDAARRHVPRPAHVDVLGGSYEASGGNYVDFQAWFSRHLDDHSAADWALQEPQLMRQWQLGAEVARHACGGGNATRAVSAADLDTALRQFITCGFVVIGPGLLPRLTAARLQRMATFAHEILDGKTVNGVSPEDVLATEHSGGRGDMWPPFNDELPFGTKLLDEARPSPPPRAPAAAQTVVCLRFSHDNCSRAANSSPSSVHCSRRCSVTMRRWTSCKLLQKEQHNDIVS